MKFRGGMSELMRQASRLQRKIEKRKEELKELTYEASAGNDQVKVTVNGAQELTKVAIDPELLKGEDLEMVQDLLVAATNAALAKCREEVDAELEKVTGGLKIPGLT
jgi:DNA-binding YbaB/EbfC family protein